MLTNDEMSRMPWTRYQMTDRELRQWLAGRQEAGRAINIQACEIGCWYVNELDEYGILKQLGELHPELVDVSINNWNFVRSSESNGWVSEGDLPIAKALALFDRIRCEAEGAG